MNNETTKFEKGKTYQTRSICDNDCIFKITIIKRTTKTVTFKFVGITRTKRIEIKENIETVMPEKYSMAPSFSADKKA